MYLTQKVLVPRVVVPPKVGTPNNKVHQFNDGVEGGDVLTIGMSKKK